jgi:hypothetical protein
MKEWSRLCQTFKTEQWEASPILVGAARALSNFAVLKSGAGARHRAAPRARCSHQFSYWLCGPVTNKRDTAQFKREMNYFIAQLAGGLILLLLSKKMVYSPGQTVI